jgi:hypothetical protein
VIKGEPGKLVDRHELNTFRRRITKVIERHHRKVGNHGCGTPRINVARKPRIELFKMWRPDAEL